MPEIFNSLVRCRCAGHELARIYPDTDSSFVPSVQHANSFEALPDLTLPVPYHRVIFETGKMLSQRYDDSDSVMSDTRYMVLDLRIMLILVREIHAAWMKCTPHPKWLRGEEYDRRKLLKVKTSLAPSDSASQMDSLYSGKDIWLEREDLQDDEDWRREIQKWASDVRLARSEVSVAEEVEPGSALFVAGELRSSREDKGPGLACDRLSVPSSPSR